MPTRTRQSADIIDVAFERMIAQNDTRTPPLVPPKSTKQKGSFASIAHSISSLFTRPSPPDPAFNICLHCRGTGHWSNDCPRWCNICRKQKGKEPRGHEAKDCRPTCANCNGSGRIKRRAGDERTSETLELLAGLASVKTVAQNFREEHLGSRDDNHRNNKTRKDIRTNIEYLTMYANMLQQDLERLYPSHTPGSISSQSPGEIEREFALLDSIPESQKYHTR